MTWNEYWSYTLYENDVRGSAPAWHRPEGGRVWVGDSRAEKGVGDLAELQACKSASGLKDAVGLLEYVGNGGAIADAKRDGVKVISV